MPIKQLAPEVAAKIAAGEVVERPASVVKELIENSIDATANHIRVDLINGGLQLIRVTDNGSGISTDELALALARHATSKVIQIDDLEHIRSLGFRGEALASIAAVAEVTLLSRQRGTLTQGAQLEAHNGQLSEITTAASAEGTTITVRNLFSSVPARLKFLKSRNTEVSHCHHLLQQYALAYPEIRFSVFSDGRQIFATLGDGKLASVLVEVYGLPIAEQMIPMSTMQRSDDPEYPGVTGYVSRPTCYKSTRQYISFFVNRRWVMSRMLTSAVEGAYHSLLLAGRHPIAVVNMQIDPALLDVNVHPAKTEIRFLKERRVFSAILNATRDALLSEPVIPQWRSNASSEISNTIMPPSDDLPAEESLSTANDATTGISSDESTPAFSLASPWMTVTEEETGSKPPLLSRLWQSHHKPSAAPQNISIPTLNSPMSVQSPLSSDLASPDSLPVLQREQQSSAATPSIDQDDCWLPQPLISPSMLPDDHAINSLQTRLLPHLRVVGQVAQSYIVTEGDNGSMYVIDQHAAHERILLERMIVAMQSRQSIAQLLLTPIKLELTPSEIQSAEEYQSPLEQLGFSFTITEDSTLEILSVPIILVKQMNVRSLHQLLIDLTCEESLGQTETWEERALANVACKAAIKANYFLTLSEMREMIEQLEQTRAPYSCCHGRPTMVHFSPSALAHAFERR